MSVTHIKEERDREIKEFSSKISQRDRSPYVHYSVRKDGIKEERWKETNEERGEKRNGEQGQGNMKIDHYKETQETIMTLWQHNEKEKKTKRSHEIKDEQKNHEEDKLQKVKAVTMWMTFCRCCACAAAGVRSSALPVCRIRPVISLITVRGPNWSQSFSLDWRWLSSVPSSAPTSPSACIWLIWLFSKDLGKRSRDGGGGTNTWPRDGSWSRTCDLSVKRSPSQSVQLVIVDSGESRQRGAMGNRGARGNRRGFSISGDKELLEETVCWSLYSVSHAAFSCLISSDQMASILELRGICALPSADFLPCRGCCLTAHLLKKEHSLFFEVFFFLLKGK